MRQHGLCSDAVGDLGSLQSRLEAELSGMKTIDACIGPVGPGAKRRDRCNPLVLTSDDTPCAR